MALILDDIGYTYSMGESLQHRALDGVSLRVEPGRVLVMAGATGSGKSTLLRIASGLLRPQTGRAELDGDALTTQRVRGSVGIVFQSPEQQLFGDTVIQDVAFGPRNLGASPEEARRQAEEALATVGLSPAEFAERSPFSLSGGQARRAAIAGVLAMRPRYLLLDEPSAGLDAPSRQTLIELIGTLRAATGVAIVTHDLDEFLPLADDVLVLADGRTAFTGTAADLLEQPEALASAGLAAPVVVQAQLAARRAGLDVDGLSFGVEGAADSIAAALARHGEAGR